VHIMKLVLLVHELVTLILIRLRPWSIGHKFPRDYETKEIFRLLQITRFQYTVSCTPIVTKRPSKHIPATHAHATIGHPWLGNGPVNMHP
jgi:hypothetical protein